MSVNHAVVESGSARDWPIGARGKIQGQEDVLHDGLGKVLFM